MHPKTVLSGLVESDRLRVLSWNVNGLRACAKKGFRAWFRRCGGDIICLQEVRARREQIPSGLKRPRGWHVDVVSAERPGYSGVAIYSRLAPDGIETSSGVPEIDAEGRVEIASFGPLLVVNAYFPNGNGKPLPNGKPSNSRVPYKLDFYRTLFDRLAADLQAGRPMLVLGDLNTAHCEIDLARPRQNPKTSGFLPEERRELDRWIDNGWVDTFRHFHPDEPDHYSWWSQRKGVRKRNVGWRLDYVFASSGAMPFVTGATIHPDVKGSDHCPVGVDLDPAILDYRA